MTTQTDDTSTQHQLVMCTICHITIPKANFVEHNLRFHSDDNPFKGIKMPGKGYQYYANCSICGTKLAQKRLHKHMEKVHGILHEKKVSTKYPNESSHSPSDKPANQLVKGKEKTNKGKSRRSQFPISWVYENKEGAKLPNEQKELSKAGSSKKIPRGRKSGDLPDTNRPLVTKEIYSNMVGDWEDIDTSKHHGITIKDQTGSNKSLAKEMADDLNASSRQCPVCNKMVDRDSYISHVATAHRIKNRKRKARGKQVDSNPATKRRTIPSQEYIKDNESDGSKHLGHVRRESSGQFGSYPLHDDYGDESNAE